MSEKRSVMRVLWLETSSRLAGLAIVEDDRLVGELTLDTRRSRTEKLHEMAGRLLAG